MSVSQRAIVLHVINDNTQLCAVYTMGTEKHNGTLSSLHDSLFAIIFPVLCAHLGLTKFFDFAGAWTMLVMCLLFQIAPTPV